jgi:hypothetical protein
LLFCGCSQVKKPDTIEHKPYTVTNAEKSAVTAGRNHPETAEQISGLPEYEYHTRPEKETLTGSRLPFRHFTLVLHNYELYNPYQDPETGTLANLPKDTLYLEKR